VPRVVAIVLVALLAACGGDDDDDAAAGIVERDREVPADVQAFLDRVADPHATAFTATYAVLTKNGGAEHKVEVTSTPPDLTLVVDGASIDPDDDVALSVYGLFAGFLADNPKAAIAATASRADADVARFSNHAAASITLDCIEIPVQRAVTATWCLTPEGLFGFVDNPSVRYELTAYDAA
jgi:hypothetical protein